MLDKSSILLIYSCFVTVTAQPICLPESWSVTNNNGLLVGWGKAAGQRGEYLYMKWCSICCINAVII